MELTELGIEDLDEAFGLYQEAIGEPGCVWDENYPQKVLIKEDIEEHCLFGIRDENGKIMGVIARDRDEDIDGLSCWNKEWMPGAELARLVVAKEYQNRGLARLLITKMQKVLKAQGFKSVHYLVAEVNYRARKSYEKLSFELKGETDLWGHHYLCYEKEL